MYIKCYVKKKKKKSEVKALTSLAAYVYRTLFLMTNHSLFPCFFLPFIFSKYPLMEELSVFADT